MAHNIIYKSTYVFRMQHEIHKLVILTNMWSSLFYNKLNPCQGLSFLPWVNKGQPMLSHNCVYFDAGPEGVQQKSGQDLSGKISAKHHCSKQAAKRTELEAHKNGGEGGGRCGGSVCEVSKRKNFMCII